MAGTALERALQKFQAGLTQEQRQQFNATSIDDVKTEIGNIQNRLGSVKKLRSLRRISQFLEAMGQIEQLVQIFLNVSNVVAFVWGPIKLTLLVAASRVESLECLLDTYVEVGEIIPSLQQYDQLFKAAPCVLEVLEKYFCDILEFHQNALGVFARPAWTKFFDATWKTFRTNFMPILESLKRHRALLHDLKLDAACLEIQISRSQTLDLVQQSSDRTISRVADMEIGLGDTYRKLSDKIYDLGNTLDEQGAAQRAAVPQQQVSAIIDKLGHPHVEDDQYNALNLCHEQSGQWIFQDSTYLKWTKSTALPESALFIHGIPGAGKTILASRIIDRLRSLPGITTLFFYFKQSDETKTSMDHMLRSLLVQLITRDVGIVPELYNRCCVVNNSEARQLSSLKSWTADLLKSQPECMIILDGLDECNHKSAGNEARQILNWLTTTVIPDGEKVGSRIRLLALGQRDGVVDSALSKYPSIRLDAVGSHHNDIYMFARSRASEIGERFGLEPAEERTMIEKVTTTAKGMFLYAKVVMDNLMAQGSLAELDQELEVKFPTGLNEAYERVVFRVLDNSARHHTHRDAAAKILRWVTCAVRPLKWNEIQCLFCIDPHAGVSNSRNKRVDSCKSLCGSLVEVDEPDLDIPQTSSVVNLVHDTARRYLIDTRRVDLLAANATMALFSSAYLASIPFDRNGDQDAILRDALTGYYGLQDYMISSWESHTALSLDQAEKIPLEIKNSLRAVLINFLQHCKFDIPSKDGIPDFESMREFLNEESFVHPVRHLEVLSSAIRKVTEEIHVSVLDMRTRSLFISLNGQPGYKCSKPKCLMFSENFESKKAREEHVAQHHNQFACPVDGCLRQTLGFTSRSGLREHNEQAHSCRVVDSDIFPRVRKSKDIWSAARTGDIDFLKDFLQKGGDSNNEDGGRRADTPLRVAAQHGQLELCQYLVRRGYSIFHAGNKMFPTKTALGAAIETCNKKLFGLLMSETHEDETREFTNSSALVDYYAAAINSGESEFVDAMLTLVLNRKDRILFDDLFYHIAIYKPVRHTDASKVYDALYTMVERYNGWENLSGPKPRDGRNYLVRACISKNPNVLSFLLQHTNPKEWHTRVNTAAWTLIFYAINNGSVECVQLLLKYGGAKIMEDYDEKGNGPLHHAYDRNAKMVKVLLPYSMRHLNDRNENGDTPLHCALSLGRGLLEIQPLLDTGAIDFSILNNEGKTVFDLTKDPVLLSALYSAANRKKGETPDLDDTSSSDRPLSLAPPVDPSASSPP
ncbi:hypothetical protein F4802DRAFT_375189 [Xylaria palmicola]|nr:hypothetical protein F4802DRAFT_375189 [Xylaria palmicola]